MDVIEGPPSQKPPDLSQVANAAPESSRGFSSRLRENPFFTAGFGLMGMGVALTGLRQGVMMASTVLRRRLIVSLEIPNKDKSYEWVLSWLAHQNELRAQSKSWIRSRSHTLSVETAAKPSDINGTGSKPVFNIIAGTGTHYFKYRGAWMQMQRERETKAMHLMTHTPWETITLTTLSRDRGLFANLLIEARDYAIRSNEGKLIVNTAWGTEWRPFGKPRRKRPLESVVLDKGVSQRIETDLRSFLARRQWYTDRGIPYRRGYLLHGPPGSGKTSFIQALAASTDYDICLLNLAERGLSDDKLNHLLSNAPERCFILIEDVDAAFSKRVLTSEDGYQSAVTFSGFLNALDGVASGEERICFLTTNHLNRLDPALIRPGRVDVSELLDDASAAQARRLYERFYRGGEIGDGDLTDLASKLEEKVSEGRARGKTISMAALQGLFIRCGAAEALGAASFMLVETA